MELCDMDVKPRYAQDRIHGLFPKQRYKMRLETANMDNGEMVWQKVDLWFDNEMDGRVCAVTQVDRLKIGGYSRRSTRADVVLTYASPFCAVTLYDTTADGEA